MSNFRFGAIGSSSPVDNLCRAGFGGFGRVVSDDNLIQVNTLLITRRYDLSRDYQSGNGKVAGKQRYAVCVQAEGIGKQISRVGRGMIDRLMVAGGGKKISLSGGRGGRGTPTCRVDTFISYPSQVFSQKSLVAYA